MSTATPTPLGWWQARLLRRARVRDVAWLAVVCLLGWGTLWSGNRAQRHLSPAGAQGAASMLDELELPGLLPNGPVQGEDGQAVPLWTLLDRPSTVLSVYAAWCGPCQEELPFLVREAGDRLVVVVSRDDDPELTRQGLANIGLKDVHPYVDVSGRVLEEGRVSALPTTFLLGRKGRVRNRVVGYSEFRLRMMLARAAATDE